MNKFMGYSKPEGLEEIEYDLSKLEESWKKLIGHMSCINSSDYDSDNFAKEVFGLIAGQRECLTMKGRCIILKNSIKNYKKTL